VSATVLRKATWRASKPSSSWPSSFSTPCGARDAVIACWWHIERGGKMLWAVGGAKSSAQLGITTAQLPIVVAGW
jgi:hypothetical protein